MILELGISFGRVRLGGLAHVVACVVNRDGDQAIFCNDRSHSGTKAAPATLRKDVKLDGARGKRSTSFEFKVGQESAVPKLWIASGWKVV